MGVTLTETREGLIAPPVFFLKAKSMGMTIRQAQEQLRGREDKYLTDQKDVQALRVLYGSYKKTHGRRATRDVILGNITQSGDLFDKFLVQVVEEKGCSLSASTKLIIKRIFENWVKHRTFTLEMKNKIRCLPSYIMDDVLWFLQGQRQSKILRNHWFMDFVDSGLNHINNCYSMIRDIEKGVFQPCTFSMILRRLNCTLDQAGKIAAFILKWRQTIEYE